MSCTVPIFFSFLFFFSFSFFLFFSSCSLHSHSLPFTWSVFLSCSVRPISFHLISFPLSPSCLVPSSFPVYAMSLSFAFLCFPFSAVPLNVSFPDLLLSCPAYFLLIFFLPFPLVFTVLSSTKSFPFLSFPFLSFPFLSFSFPFLSFPFLSHSPSSFAAHRWCCFWCAWRHGKTARRYLSSLTVLVSRHPLPALAPSHMRTHMQKCIFHPKTLR